MGTDTAKGFAAISARVTRSVFEKVDQNIVQPFFCQNELHSRETKSITKICATSVISQKLPKPKPNNLPIGENSPNLVTLISANIRVPAEVSVLN
jgi:hypothetical protein